MAAVRLPRSGRYRRTRLPGTLARVVKARAQDVSGEGAARLTLVQSSLLRPFECFPSSSAMRLASKTIRPMLDNKWLRGFRTRPASKTADEGRWTHDRSDEGVARRSRRSRFCSDER